MVRISALPRFLRTGEHKGRPLPGEHKGRPLPKRGSDVAARGILRTTHIIILKSKDDQQATPVSAGFQAS